jgi:(1->4)-alpha-D-glucan 1-alpha-D-glucosylmutase
VTRSTRRIPSSTYRLQLHREFTFEDVTRRLDYFDALGVTHLYLSPITEAVPGSMHGYDVVDPTRINPELGGEAGFRALAHAARAPGLGIILDIVPNHMSTSEANPRWMDVLRLGQGSAYAHWFDIDWEARDSVAHRGKVLLPVLGDDLDRIFERHELAIEVTAGDGWLRYFDHRFPLAPETFEVSNAGHDEPDVRAVLGRQHYVLEYWRAAKAHVNYRRFFTIDELIGVRVEDIDVFHGTHELFGRLMREGLIDGVRVDHADGLSDPAEYFRRVRALLGDEAYIVAEKILAEGEQLPETWPIDGTSGYEAMDLIGSVFVDTRNEDAFKTIYATSTGRPTDFDALAYTARKRILDGPLRGQFERAASQLYRSLESPAIEADALTSTLRQLLACIPVYRTYHATDALDPTAAGVIEEARAAARHHAQELDSKAIEIVAHLLAAPPEASRIAVMRLQQLMPAVQAKAIEDNAFYRYVPLLSRSEVGSHPTLFGRSLTDFHASNVERSKRWPASMVATATHDHKRGEDVRARLNALSELPEAWRTFLENCAAAPGADKLAPLDHYVAIQTIAGIWPIAAEEMPAVAKRLQQYLIKASREAAERTTWDDPSEEYESALETFADALVAALTRKDTRANETFLKQISRLGEVNSLGQVVLKAMLPGVPDTYQGTELRDLSLVDPDNRRPVDYDHRATLLAELQPLLEDSPPAIEARPTRVRALLDHPDDAAIKLYVLARALRTRRALHPLCIEGDYIPIEVRGALGDHLIAFARRSDDRSLIAVVSRLTAPLTLGLGDPIDWADTALVLPAELAGPLRNLLTEEAATPSSAGAGATLPVRAILGTLPVAILEAVAQQ